MTDKTSKIFRDAKIQNQTTLIKIDLSYEGVNLKDYRMKQFTSGVDLEPELKFSYFINGIVYTNSSKSTGTRCNFLVAQWNYFINDEDNFIKYISQRNNIVTYIDFQNGKIVNNKDGFEVQLGAPMKNMEGFLKGKLFTAIF